MFPRPVVIALFVLAGPILVFEAYGIHQLRRPPPPPFESSLDEVCARLLQSTRAKGMTGAAQGIEAVSGPEHDGHFDSLPSLLNARLEPGFKTFLFSDDVRKTAVAEIGRLMKRQDWVASPRDMTQTTPEILLLAEWRPLPGDEVGLTLRAVRLGMNGEGVLASIRFPHPKVRQREQRQRHRLQWALYGATVPLVTLTIMSIGNWMAPRPPGGSHHGPTL